MRRKRKKNRKIRWEKGRMENIENEKVRAEYGSGRKEKNKEEDVEEG